MNLDEYKKKRDFEKTPESKPQGPTSNDNFYIIQKHSARALHFDFRINYNGVLVSWAIPKGLPNKIGEKRLAIHTEDHPIEYAQFQGEIPKGQYGAGLVELYDKGNYFFVGSEKPPDKHLKIILHGEQSDGFFDFIDLKNDKQEWLIIKHDYTLESLLAKGMRDSLRPPFFPMLAQIANEPFDDKNWLFEFKLDGYRIIAQVKNRKATLYSRNSINFTQKFPKIAETLSQIKENIIIDGEIVSLDKSGHTNFQSLQLNPKNLYYYVFDCLAYEEYNLTKMRLIDRKRILRLLLKDRLLNIRYLDHVEKEGKKLFNLSKQQDLEGIMAKEKNSPYENRRSSSWRKIKNIKTQEVAIVGFTDPTNKDYFASLAIALPEKNNFRYLGKVGTGFNLALKKLLFEKITQLITENPTVVNPPKEKINWLKPTLVAEIKYREITKDGFVRQPVYLGLREDIEPHKIFLDLPADDPELTNLDKIYWPTEKITKGDMIEYYKKISKNLLPYIQNRPLSLNRYPSGIQKDHFYQKNFADVPSYVKTVSVSSQNRESTNYIICNNLETLKYITNLGSIEINPWLSQEPKLEYPDLIVIDLDPEAIDFSYVIKSAQTINEIFLRANIKAYLKTSGATGLHILIPIEPKYTFEQTQNIAHIIAQLANRRILGFTSLVRSPSKRQHKVYLDYLQNAKGQTIVAPYSLRPLPGAPVSTPLKWQELNDKLNPKDYNFFTIFNRLKNNGDIFQNITNNRQTLETILEKLEKI